MDEDEQIAALGDDPLTRLITMMKRLRDPQTGCAWDIKQTFASIAPYTIEEAYEVSDAIERNDLDDLKSELGDLLLQVVFHAQIGDDLGAFDFTAISDGLVRKMVRRHPHVFGDADERDAESQTRAWEEIKAQERQTAKKKGVLDGVAKALPALKRAEKLQNRAARVGFDWPDIDPVIDKIAEESRELKQARNSGESQSRIHEEMGDLLFVIANLARHLKVDPEQALKDANGKFIRRFEFIETHSEADLDALSLDEMDVLWDEAKRRGL